MERATGQGSPTPRTGKRPRYFYGWNIVGVSFIASISNTEHNTSILGLFFNPLKAEFGWSRTSIAGVQSFNRALEGFIAPVVGPFLDRHGPRQLMLVGGLIAGLAFFGLTQMSALWHFYLLRGAVLAVGFAMAGGLVIHTAISNWFIRRRGRAIAIANMGSHLGNTMMAPLTVLLIATSWGWQGAFLVFGILTWLAVPLPAILFMRRRPEDVGLYPDGMAPQESRNATPAVEMDPNHRPSPNVDLEPVWTRQEVLKTTTFWFLVISSTTANLSLSGINISLAPYIQDLGFGGAMLALIMASRTTIQLLATPLWGLAAEYVELPIIRVLPFVLQALSCIFFLLAAQAGFLWLAVIVYGMGNAGARVVQDVLWADCFGRLSLGTVRSMAAVFRGTVVAAGPLFMNAIFDITGSYSPAYLIFIAFYSVTIVLMWNCRPPQARRFALPEEIR